MSDPHPSRPRRRTLLLVGAGVGVLLAATGAVALVSGLAIADQPGRSLDVPALVVEVDPGSVAPTPTPSPSDPGSPALVPAPTPVVVDDDDADDAGDDHGGDRPDDSTDDSTND